MKILFTNWISRLLDGYVTRVTFVSLSKYNKSRIYNLRTPSSDTISYSTVSNMINIASQYFKTIKKQLNERLPRCKNLKNSSVMYNYPILATLDHLRNHSLRDYRHEIKGEPRVIPGPKRRGKPTHPSPKYRGHLPRVVRLLTRRRTRRIRFWATPTSARRWPSYAWSLTSVRTGTRSSGAASGGSV